MITDPLLTPRVLQQVLRKYHLPPLDRFGQHFLVDALVLQRIIAAADADPTLPIVEIGAGLGVLTRALAEAREAERPASSAPIIALEIDRRLIPLLTERLKAFPTVRIIHGDVLHLDPQTLDLETPYDVIGNIPYNITAKLLRHLLSWSPRPRRMTFLMDAAVARRVTARPPDMRVLAVSVHVYAEPMIVEMPIPPSAFLPEPKVASAIIRFNLRDEPRIPQKDRDAFFRLVRAGFSQKRKTLQNALRAFWRCAPAESATILNGAGIDATRRAQTLTIEEWYTLLKSDGG
jgi:16S rRNA (adenine1518-N6/adenine1519-N6)-dimethyltransferase